MHIAHLAILSQKSVVVNSKKLLFGKKSSRSLVLWDIRLWFKLKVHYFFFFTFFGVSVCKLIGVLCNLS